MRNWIRGYRGLAKAAVILATIVIIYFYHSLSRYPSTANVTQIDDERVFYIPKFGDKNGYDEHAGKGEKMEKLFSPYLKPKSTTYECSYLDQSGADIDTIREFPNFEFQPRWLQSREFWNKTFEDRYERYLASTDRPPLKVIIVPHSHNDPGWLKTFEGYFQQASRKILNNIVAKLQEYPQMTFIWSEISFLSMWWDSAHPTKQKALKKLIKEGRFEITTGGWVMADEATTHFYSLINQLVEGHLWMKDNLGVIPETAWSVDPFGHGPVIPHLLSSAGLEGAVVQRLHYAWKQWFAYNQIEDFLWISGWQDGKNGMLTHNQPYDIYSIRHSCGPHPSVCLNFDFRKIPGEITDYAMKSEPITDENVYNKAALLMGQYMRTGSLTKHNVVLMPLGDDFRYNTELEFNQQYTNYKKLLDHINNNKHLYRNSEIKFGTPKDYFSAIKERMDKFPTLKGDFFVYADIFSEGRPAYWSGYFTTRPFLKLMSRQLEHHLRNAEISFTLALNRVRQSANEYITKRLEKYYESLIKARRNLALFQHHDAITGTSKSIVMYDYGIKMFDSINDCIKIQETSIEALYPRNKDFRKGKFLQSDFDWEMFEKMPEKRVISIGEKRIFVLFNSLAHERYEVITLKINSSNIRIIDNHNNEEIPFQISPVWVNNEMVISETDYNIIFIAHLPKLSLVSYTVEPVTSNSQESKPFATIYCNLCKMQSNSDSVDNNSDTKDPFKMNNTFVVKSLLPGDIQLQNPKLKLLIDGTTGFLKSVYLKELRKKKQCSIEFGAYQSAQQHSGAYLFMPNIENPEKDILKQYSENSQGDHRVAASGIVIISGPIVTEVTSVYQTFLSHTLKIFNSQSSYLNSGMFMENEVDFGNPPKNRETELFMRIQTNIQNGDPPEFFTDQNGFEYQKRVKVQKLPIEGNYYPITTMAFLQDHKTRLTFITDHVLGASAFEPGRLELMLDRRTLYDDGRGMGEGLVDNRISKFQSWILMESFNVTRSYSRFKRNSNTVIFRKQRSLFKENLNGDKEPLRHFNIQKTPSGPFYDQPSFNALKLSNTLSFPVNTFVVENFKKMEYAVINKPHIDFLKGDFPCDVNLVTLRTNTDPEFEEFPQKSSLMILHRMGFSCNITEGIDQWNNCNYNFNKDVTLAEVNIQELNLVSLTGLHKGPKINSFRDINIETMSVQTVNITFA